MTHLKRRRVLLITFGVSGEDVSEPFAAFKWVEGLQRVHDVTLLCYNGEQNLGAVGRQIPGLRVFEWKERGFWRLFPRFTAMLKPDYLRYYRLGRRKIRELLRQEEFDLIHQIAPFSVRYPSLATGMGLPFIVGPVGGSLPTPTGFQKEAGSMAFYTKLRGLDGWRLEHDPLLRRSFSSADLVLGVAPYVKDLLSPIGLRDFEVMNEYGLDELREKPHGTRERGRLRLLYVGRIVRTKGARDAIRAMGQLEDLTGVTLDIVGAGDDEAACRREAELSGAADRIVFHGWLPRPEVDRFYRESDVFLFPSFREAGGGVVLEAMSFGMPLIVAATGGPGYLAEGGCGIRVPTQTPAQFAADLAAAIRRLADEPSVLDEMSHKAWSRASEVFAWERKIERVCALYERVLTRARSGESPHTPA